jgi:hypothetical protein
VVTRLRTIATIFRAIARLDIDNATEINRGAATVLTNIVGGSTQQQNSLFPLNLTQGKGFSLIDLFSSHHPIAEMGEPGFKGNPVLRRIDSWGLRRGGGRE